jgi:hypothetical protein
MRPGAPGVTAFQRLLHAVFRQIACDECGVAAEALDA